MTFDPGRLAFDFGLSTSDLGLSTLDFRLWTFDFGLSSDRHFISYLFRAKASAAEVRSQVYIAFHRRYLLQTEFDSVLKIAQETSRPISGFLSYLGSPRKQWRGSAK